MTTSDWRNFDDLADSQLAAAEQRTGEIGRELFGRLNEKRPTPLQRRWWDDRVMRLAMKDESLKVQLFRFVDVLPMLRTSEDVVAHLHEYLAPIRNRLPRTLSVALGLTQRAAIVRGAVGRAARLGALDLARRFIAGTNTGEVVAAAQRERQLGRGFTLDILGEAVISELEANQFFRAYVELIEAVAPAVNAWPDVAAIDHGVRGRLPRMNLSVKLSALDEHFDAVDPNGALDRAGARLRELLRVARTNRAFINIDMESYDKKDLTLWLFQRVLEEQEFRDFGDVGIVIQCYLRDAARDLHALRDWAQRRGHPVWVRLVKGAYWDYETVRARAERWPIPVFQQKWQSDACFEWATRFVLQNHQHLRPAIGSHNLRSIAHALAVAEVLELPPHGVEMQMLYGMADDEKRALVALGRRVRVYMPYGELIPGMAYLVRRLLENTSNDSFLRAGTIERASLDTLLDKPCDPGTPTPDSGPLPESTMNQHPPSSHFQATFPNQPPVDFAESSNRLAMQNALQDVFAQFGRHYPLVIGGQAVTTETKIDSLDPSFRDRLIGHVSSADASHADHAVAAAKAAWHVWSASGVEHRAEFLRKTAAVMRERLFELAAWAVYECGKGWREATNDVCEAIDFCEFYAAGAVAMEQPSGSDVPGEENRFRYLPRGVVAVIAPWNFPLAILTGMTTAALATGNTVVMKPAEQSSVVGAKLMEIFTQVGLPAGVANFLPGDGATVGGALVDHPDVAMIAFTGSREVGLQVNARAAIASARGLGMVKYVIAEMGGKNAIIVDDDADLDEAVSGVAMSAFGYQGQKCSACSRAIVLQGVYEAFLGRLVEAARSLRIGPAEAPSTDVGPVIDDDALGKVHQYIALGRQEGEEELAVEIDEELAQRGCFVGPHIYSEIAPDARLAREEVFGPVLAVIRAADLDDAIRIANSAEYALTGGIFSRSPAALERAKRELLVGNLYVNRGITGAIVGRQPFGGFKMSGIGSKAGGDDYLLQFVVPQTITENTMRRGFAPNV